jgi:hypothetical protein
MASEGPTAKRSRVAIGTAKAVQADGTVVTVPQKRWFRQRAHCSPMSPEANFL